MSVVRLLVLGAIRRRGAAHGYRIHRDLKEWRVETWTIVRPGSIYHAISQLESLGFIRSAKDSPSQKSGPAKTGYELTGTGGQEFINLLEEALKAINLIELSVGIAFMEYLPRQRVIELLRERAKAQRQIPAFLKTLPSAENPAAPSEHPELIRVWVDYYICAAASTDKLLTAIQSGTYVFKGEGVQKWKR